MSDTPEDTARLDDATVAAEEDEARREHVADRPPTEDEERRADELELDPQVAASYEEMNRIGADVKGEGEIG